MPALPDTPIAPLAIYVHWPFCLSKCPYCDFNSHVRDSIDETAWADALCRELTHYRGLSGPRQVTSVFFGGGTPSLMAATTTERVLTTIAQLWTVDRAVEITLEANPTSVEAQKFKDFSAAGINRVSLGIQALQDEDLKALGREHSVSEALDAIALSQKYFTRSSFDLIYARMGQSLTAWETELKQALALVDDSNIAGHLSLYQLTIERGTSFYHAHKKGRLILPEEDVAADMYDLTQQICNAHGLPAYEVSNHARPGEESRHNLAYWTYQDYIGVGPGAHGRLTIEGELYALTQDRSPEKWLKNVAAAGHATDQKEALSAQMKAEEMIMMGLRLNGGIALDAFEKRVGQKIDEFIDSQYLERLFELDYMEKAAYQPAAQAQAHLGVTAQGMPLLNGLLGRLLA
ncbi:radical SAM family heme chaperone HemW [Paremcibacter congregatus]|uniref:Heme chaperone HemW n=1 Tax=Paremcibacter congregatus TaxID=2043170 RepID=A0A2G4YSJ5_9PROT|nr:radical SAM family heme chaperone HemW [Paremcibacter congregatus]PHZ85295.1 coproporphyrinogen III oxidase [Paremcibacter congregatus]QDE27773.1 coproporphyrinogen III oxidase [Paremcibacter congregatus]